ncbi:anti-phage dCTP deaminase [Lonsdalea quercina]|uniref:anti-phage dCTP deaminase n=1 Tax=Lonsdalea quercina TaxID=71657 RepID=UPI003975959E
MERENPNTHVTQKPSQSLENGNSPSNGFPSEIFIGLVCSVGTEIETVVSALKERFSLFDYHTEEIRISKHIIEEINGKENTNDKYKRINNLMTIGNKFREQSKCNYILSLGAIKKINQIRNEKFTSKTLYIINSIKHPEEAHKLKEVYGQGFYLFGIFSDEKTRLENLNKNKGISKDNSSNLIKRDENEDDGHGQHTRDTYHLSDFFIKHDGKNNKRLKNDIKRIVELLFGNPFITPTFDEFAMYMAFSSALRSADLSRQVGAVIAKNDLIVSTGANDVPKYGGGLYWPYYNNDGEIVDFPNGRDYKRGFDSNAEQKNDIIEGILAKVSKRNKGKLREILKESKIKDITEYGRVVHAEMEAIISCARNNTSPVGASIYCTTFPCHNCAKHIIASGINRVVYIEPYPKSKALQFHDESATTNIPHQERDDIKLVIFEPFIGIGPRVFFELFSLTNYSGSSLIRKGKDGNIIKWSERNSNLRHKSATVSYFENEQASINLFGDLIGVKNEDK